MPDGDRGAVRPNELLEAARKSVTSPSGSGRAMSRQELAEAVNAYLWTRHKKRVYLDRTYIGKLELGKHRWPNALYREAMREVLGVGTDAEIGFYGSRRASTRADRRGLVASQHDGEYRGFPIEGAVGEHAQRLLQSVRLAVLVPQAGDGAGTPGRLQTLESMVAEAHRRYQRADYDAALDLIPRLMGTIGTATTSTPNAQRRRLNVTVSAAHLAVSKLTLKYGDAQLAWVAADRALGRATDTESQALIAAASFSVGCAMFAMPDRWNETAEFMDRVLTRMGRRRPQDPAEMSAFGAVNLLAALVAARLGQRREAHEHLRRAGELAERLGGDQNHLWTGFGPTNVLIHQIGITAHDDPRRAIDLGDGIDTSVMHPALVSRRSQVHLDLATAFTYMPGGDASATLHLLQAEDMAPQLFRIHPPARALIDLLLGRERRAATPGLRGLASRAGVTR